MPSNGCFAKLEGAVAAAPYRTLIHNVPKSRKFVRVLRDPAKEFSW